MKVKVKRRKKRPYTFLEKIEKCERSELLHPDSFAMYGDDIVNVNNHYLVLVICEVDEKAMVAKWRFSYNGTLYGDYIPFRINTKNKLQQIKQAVNALIDQQDTVRKELNNGYL